MTRSKGIGWSCQDPVRGMSFIVVGVVIGVHNQMNSFTVVILSLNLGVTATGKSKNKLRRRTYERFQVVAVTAAVVVVAA